MFAAVPPSPKPIAQLSIAELIDRLVLVGNDEFAVRTNILVWGENGQGDLPPGLLKVNDPEPPAAAAMKELVRRGPAALPELVAHLGDVRKTKAIVHGLIGGVRFSGEFDWNENTSRTHPIGTIRKKGDEQEVKLVGAPEGRGNYTLAVGDLCFYLVGIIVNRDFETARCQPSAMIIVNSPVLCPSLREAVQKDWEKVTPKQLEESLIADTLWPDFQGRDQSAIEVLRRYYPKTAVATLRKRLAVPVYDPLEVEKFVEQEIYFSASPAECKSRIERFITENSPAYRDALIVCLWDRKGKKAGEPMWEGLPIPIVKTAPAKVLAELAPKINFDKRPVLELAEINGTVALIQFIAERFPADADGLLWEVFQRSSTHKGHWTSVDQVAFACIQHLVHKGRDGELLAYCQRRLKEFSKLEIRGSDYEGRDFLETAVGLITTIQKN